MREEKKMSEWDVKSLYLFWRLSVSARLELMLLGSKGTFPKRMTPQQKIKTTNETIFMTVGKVCKHT